MPNSMIAALAWPWKLGAKCTESFSGEGIVEPKGGTQERYCLTSLDSQNKVTTRIYSDSHLLLVRTSFFLSQFTQHTRVLCAFCILISYQLATNPFLWGFFCCRPFQTKRKDHKPIWLQHLCSLRWLWYVRISGFYWFAQHFRQCPQNRTRERCQLQSGLCCHWNGNWQRRFKILWKKKGSVRKIMTVQLTHQKVLVVAGQRG